MTQPLFIVMRSFNDAPVIRKTLEMVHSQEYPVRPRLIHIDSGSTDGTIEIIQSFHPEKLIQIKPHEYIAGKVLNCGMNESTGDWVVFLNSDAQPVDTHWLDELITAAHSSEKNGTAFSRQLPRPDCKAVYAYDYDRCFGPERESVRWPHFFSMVSSIVNRRAWQEQPFRNDLTYAEDDEWSLRIKAHGWNVMYAEKSIAIHSHNYTLKQSYKRCYGDLFAKAASDTIPPRNFNWHHTVVLGSLLNSLGDFKYCLRHGKLHQWPHALAVRFAQRLGKMHGYHDGWKHFGRSLP